MKKIQEASEDITCWRNFVQVPKPIQKKKTKRKEKTALRAEAMCKAHALGAWIREQKLSI